MAFAFLEKQTYYVNSQRNFLYLRKKFQSDTSMRFNNILPELYVIDFHKSLHFYTDILGFKLEYDRPKPLFAFLSYQAVRS